MLAASVFFRHNKMEKWIFTNKTIGTNSSRNWVHQVYVWFYYMQNGKNSNDEEDSERTERTVIKPVHGYFCVRTNVEGKIGFYEA